MKNKILNLLSEIKKIDDSKDYLIKSLENDIKAEKYDNALKKIKEINLESKCEGIYPIKKHEYLINYRKKLNSCIDKFSLIEDEIDELIFDNKNKYNNEDDIEELIKLSNIIQNKVGNLLKAKIEFIDNELINETIIKKKKEICKIGKEIELLISSIEFDE